MRLAAEYDVDIDIRVVLPIAVRILGFFDTVYPLWPPYLLRDAMRIAEYEGIPYGWPRPDPIVRDFVTRKVARGRARLAPRDRRRILSRRRRRRPMTLTVARRGDGRVQSRQAYSRARRRQSVGTSKHFSARVDGPERGGRAGVLR